MVKNMLYQVDVNLGNIKKNIQSFKTLVGPDVQIMTIVKANAYGHGAVEVAKAVVSAGSSMLGVVTINEAIELRKAGITDPILVIGYVEHDMFSEAINKNITISIYDLDMAILADQIAEKEGSNLSIHIKVDTGLSRMGFLDRDFEAIQNIFKLKNLKISGIFTHLADAENPNSWQTGSQLDRFDQVLSQLKKSGYNLELVHAGASAAALLFPRSRYNMIRLGISAYGLWPSEETKEASMSLDYLQNFKLYPALSYRTKLVHIKEVEAGSLVGYGGTFRTRKRTKIGVIPVGYAEGFDRSLSNQGEVLLNGQRVKVIGNICMNMTILNLENFPAKVGDEVVLIGSQGQEVITADEMAKKVKTINYEITTRIPLKIPRKYV